MLHNHTGNALSPNNSNSDEPRSDELQSNAVNETDQLDGLKDVNGDDCPPISAEIPVDEEHEWLFCEDCGGLDLSTERCIVVSSHDLFQHLLSNLMQLEGENWRYKNCPC